MNKLKLAQLEHQEWLRKRGIVRRDLKGTPFPDYTIGRREVPKTSDAVVYHPSPKERDYLDPTYMEAVREKAKTVAPSFNKGPLQPQTNTDFTKSGRRS